MCGFVGVVGYGNNFPDLEQLRRMRETLVHRGPDDAGEYYENGVAFGFRRLAIIDLSPKGHQPMSNSSGNLVIVFNGEIFNYVELRDKLSNLGYQFKGNSDTEVLLTLYEHYGTEMFQYINGFFAFAIYNKITGDVILARDRLGVKPLFYWENNKTIAFSSELKALKVLPNFPRILDSTAIAMYLRLNFVPGTTCVYEDVKKLPPAHYLSFNIANPDQYTLSKYWEVDWDIDTENHSEEYWLDRIDELLNDAVRIRLRSDAPIGTFLSGGIDSGLITAIAAKISGNDLQAFTVSFPGSSADEKIAAMASAKHIGISTHVEEISDNSIELLPELATHLDEPFADMSIIPTYLICEKMRNKATVILSGDGGDELFGGYVYHPLAWKLNNLDAIPDLLMTPIMKLISYIMPDESYLARNAKRLSLPSRMRGAFLQRDICESWQKKVLNSKFHIHTDDLILNITKDLDLGMGKTMLDRAQSADLKMLLPDNMLVKVDRMSMKSSIEVRSPFLDYRFTELITKIPPELRVKNGQSKYLLRRLAERYLPHNVVHGHKKGFDVSPAQWFSGNNKAIIQKHIDNPPEYMQIFKEYGLETLWNNYQRYPKYQSALLRVLCLNLWARGNPPI